MSDAEPILRIYSAEGQRASVTNPVSAQEVAEARAVVAAAVPAPVPAAPNERVRTLAEVYSRADYPGDTPQAYSDHRRMSHNAGLLAVYKLGTAHGRDAALTEAADREAILDLLNSAQHAPSGDHDQDGGCRSCPWPLYMLGPDEVADALVTHIRSLQEGKKN